MQVPRGKPARLERVAVLVMLLVLLGAVACAGPLLGPRSPCRHVLKWEKRLSLVLSAGPESGRAPEERRSVVLRLTHPPGLELWRFGPDGHSVHCAELSSERAESWVTSTEALLEEAPQASGVEAEEPTETIGAAYRGRQAAVAVARLSPRGLEAATNVACLALEALGDEAFEPIHDVAPRLIKAIGLPSSCPAAARGLS